MSGCNRVSKLFFSERGMGPEHKVNQEKEDGYGGQGLLFREEE
jgi:hypothetical protein